MRIFQSERSNLSHGFTNFGYPVRCPSQTSSSALQKLRPVCNTCFASPCKSACSGERLEVTVETISRFERSVVLPSLVRLFALADVFAVPVSQLLQKNSTRQSDLAAEIVQLLERLSNDDQVWVGNWLTELCERLSYRRPARKR
jgi:hypothetical protein